MSPDNRSWSCETRPVRRIYQHIQAVESDVLAHAGGFVKSSTSDHISEYEHYNHAHSHTHSIYKNSKSVIKHWLRWVLANLITGMHSEHVSNFRYPQHWKSSVTRTSWWKSHLLIQYYCHKRAEASQNSWIQLEGKASMKSTKPARTCRQRRICQERRTSLVERR